MARPATTRSSPCASDVFLVAWKQENGRYGEGLDKLDRLYGKKRLITMRNWNTILKALA